MCKKTIEGFVACPIAGNLGSAARYAKTALDLYEQAKAPEISEVFEDVALQIAVAAAQQFLHFADTEVK